MVRALFVLLAVLGVSAELSAAELAVIVNPKNPVDELTLAELAAICRLDRQHWRTGRTIGLILQESGTPEKRVLLDRVYTMDDAALKQFWLEKLYRGEIASFPHVEPSSVSARRLVARAENAIAFVDAAIVDPTVKVVRVGGRLPGEAGYPLSSR